MVANKTRPTSQPVEDFLKNIEEDQKREDTRAIVTLMKEITGEPPMMWGDSIIGFGSYHYKYKTGREGDFFKLGVAPRKRDISIHMPAGFKGLEGLLDQLGPHSTGVSCLYVKHLSAIDMAVLRQLLEAGLEMVDETWG